MLKPKTIAIAICTLVIMLSAFLLAFAKQQPEILGTDDRVEITGEQAKTLMAAWQRFLHTSQKDKPPVTTDVLRFTLQLYGKSAERHFDSVILNVDGRPTERSFAMHYLSDKPTLELSGDRMKALLLVWDRLTAVKGADHDVTSYSFTFVRDAKTTQVFCYHALYSVYWPTVDPESGKVASDGVSITSDNRSYMCSVSRDNYTIKGQYILPD